MPRLSIGMPVYNGERYMARAVESLLAQTFGDFALLICDNASTDGTEDLARDFEKRDRRVRYHRNPENIGAAANFNLSFDRSERCEWFKWAACDDLWAPTYLQRCAEALDAAPKSVLAHSRTRVIGEDDEDLGIYHKELDTGSPRPSWRYRVLLTGHGCYEVFGVIRREILEKTGLIGGFSRGDAVLLVQLALFGPFERIPEPLFMARRHEGQSMTMVGDFVEYSSWFNPSLRGNRVHPRWRWSFEYLRSIRLGRIGPYERLRCVAFWTRSMWKVRKLLAAELGPRRKASSRPQATGGKESLREPGSEP